MVQRGKSILHLTLSPFQVSWRSRLQTLAVIHFVFCWILLPLLSSWLPVYVLFCTPFWWTIVLYGAWTFYDWNSPRKGVQGWKWYKNNAIWHYFAEYFPLKLIKTAELPPDRNYIIGSHPHGVLSVGAFTSMLTDATGFPSKFPGLTSTILTLNGQFYFPFRRDIGIALGGAESSRESLRYLLENPGKGRAIAIVIGGATEALDTRPGDHSVNLLCRRGFCRFAIMHGADLVPMYNFGENDIYDTLDNSKGSRLREVQYKIKDICGFCPPLFSGTGVFNKGLGLLPHRKPITSVIGSPIRVQKNLNPSDAEVDVLHSKYCSALIRLFEDYKHLHNIPKDECLNIY